MATTEEDGSKTPWQEFQLMEPQQKSLIYNLAIQLFMLVCLLIAFIIKAEDPFGIETIFYILSFGVFNIAQYYFAYSAIKATNGYELISFMVMSFLSYFGTIFKTIPEMKFTKTQDGQKTGVLYGLLIFDITLTVNQFFYIFSGIQVFKRMQWKTYKKLGASAAVQNAYRNLQIYLSLIRFTGTIYQIQFIAMIYISIANFDQDPNRVVLPGQEGKSPDQKKSSVDGWQVALQVFLLLVASSICSLGYLGAKQGQRRWILWYIASVFLYWIFRVIMLFRFVESHKNTLLDPKHPSTAYIGVALLIEIMSLLLFIALWYFGYQHLQILDQEVFQIILKAEKAEATGTQKRESQIHSQTSIVETSHQTFELQKKETTIIPDDAS